jgi:hypothetical protein
MRTIKYVIALLLTMTGVGSMLVHAQGWTQDTTVTTIPFDFVIGKESFPAGKYVISQSSGQSLRGPLVIHSADGETAAFFSPTTEESSDQYDKPKLVFVKHDGTYFLTKVVGALDTYTVATNFHQQKPADPNATVTVPSP